MSSSASSKTVVKGSSAASNFVKESSSSLCSAVVGKITSQDFTFVQVQRKLRNHKQYKGLSGDELKEKAKELSDPEPIFSIFSHLLEGKLARGVEDLHEDKADPLDYRNPQEVLEAKNREKNRHIQVANIPLKVSISDLEGVPPKIMPLVSYIGNFLCEDYGAKHVALIVGDVLLEWGKENLVIPQISEQGKEALPDNDIQDVTKHCPHNKKADRKASLQEAFSLLKTAEQEAEHLFQSTREKRPLFEALAMVIFRYNTKYYYNPLSRNCQGFLRDALKALGIEYRPPPLRITEHMQEMQTKKDKDIPSGFARHEDLDAYIMKHSQEWLEHLDPDTLEFLQLVYLQFHGDITCHLPTCQASFLSDALHNRLTVNSS